MWRVQTEGYTEGRGQLIGLVSRDVGFSDSPDTEWISSGVNSKSSRAVAIGRHGNFLLWGFAASPTYLTDEAQRTFVNAVHYIARFDGKAPIARKRPGTASRHWIEEALASVSEAGYRKVLAGHEARIARAHADRERIRARIEQHLAVSASERRILEQADPAPPPRWAPIRRFVSDEEWRRLGGDEQAIQAYFADRLPYMRSKGWYKLEVDEELRAFGVGNADRRFVPTMIAALSGERAAAAQRLLERYTVAACKDADAWRAWYEQNAARLFFTEAGGYLWLVDTTGESGLVVRRDGRESEDARAAPSEGEGRGKTVRASLSVVPKEKDHQVLVDVQIAKGWWAYQEVPVGLPYAVFELELDLPDGCTQVGVWTTPASRPSADEPGLRLYEGRLRFACTVRGKLPATLAATLRYQVCNERMCERPTERLLQARTAPAKQR